jgi:hypothetical protein
MIKPFPLSLTGDLRNRASHLTVKNRFYLLHREASSYHKESLHDAQEAMETKDEKNQQREREMDLFTNGYEGLSQGHFRNWLSTFM